MKKGTDDIELVYLITRKLSGEATTDDLTLLDQLVAQSDENKKLYEEFVRTWEESDKARGITQEDTNEEWVRLENAIRQTRDERSSFSFIKIAASVAIIISCGIALYFLNQNKQIEIIASEIQTESLADGSLITLNASAELSYPPGFDGPSREVNLKGEAFFEIEKDVEKPFIIHTASLDVKVLGTSFNVRAIEKEPTVEVVVSTGRVEISSGGKAIPLEVGERGILDKSSGQLFKVPNDDQNFNSWKTKIFIFNDLALEEVIFLLNNAYKSSLYLRSNEIAKCPVTVKFEGESLSSILEILKATLELSAQETNRGIELSGEGC